MPATGPISVAELVVEFLVARKVDRVFGLQGGHVQPIWDQLAQRGVRIIDVRDEGAAVHMAHAHAALTGGLGVVLVTAGPGVTNCVTAMANAELERVPLLLIGGCAPRAQDDFGPLQGVPQTDILAPVTRLSRTLRVADNLLRDLDKAVSAALGDGSTPGPVYVEIPTDVLRETVHPNLVLDEYLQPRPPRCIPPDPADVQRAAALLAAAKCPLVITGRGAMGAGRSWLASWKLPAPSISTHRKAAALCRPTTPRSWALYAAGRCRRRMSSSSSAASWTINWATARRQSFRTLASFASPIAGKSWARTGAVRSSCSPARLPPWQSFP